MVIFFRRPAWVTARQHPDWVVWETTKEGQRVPYIDSAKKAAGEKKKKVGQIKATKRDIWDKIKKNKQLSDKYKEVLKATKISDKSLKELSSVYEELKKIREQLKEQGKFQLKSNEKLKTLSGREVNLKVSDEDAKEIMSFFKGDTEKIEQMIDSQAFTDCKITLSYQKNNIKIFGRDLKTGTQFQRHFFRQGGKLIAEHRFFDVPKQYQAQYRKSDKSIGKTLLAQSYKNYKKMGVSRIELQAGLEIGGYAWAKYGFDSDSNFKKTKINEIERFIGEKIPITQNDHIAQIAALRMSKEEFQKAIEGVNYRDYWPHLDSKEDFQGFIENRLKEVDERGNINLGKVFLLGTSWHGKLDISKENEGHRIFKSYVGVK